MSSEQDRPVTLKIAFPSGEMEVRQALAELRRGLAPMELAPEDEGAIELVLGEVLNNVVEHAYGPGKTGEVEMACTPRGGALDFEVRDGGRALPGLTLPEGVLPDLDCARDDLPEGGFGWFLVKSLVTGLRYERRAGCNLLRFRVPLGGGEGRAG